MAAAAAKARRDSGGAAPRGQWAPAAPAPRRRQAPPLYARAGGRAPRRPISAPRPPAPASGAPRLEGGLAGGPTPGPRVRRALCPPPFRRPGLLTSRPRPAGPWAETREKGAARCAQTQPCLRCLPDFWSNLRTGAPRQETRAQV
ncbi:proline-rich protein HaeIII subfamily 1-like [Cervus elaphus]|uniref:proline-rich protein HaeIII subfamily 1-like n=1 Tax=Cervus elaphus TaxID=9860 RepID=UPI001CC2F842|nr:proline-rich protein HaeIII subfamily 1-like [Cervus elaphus]